MEEDLIRQKFQRGYIDLVVVKRRHVIVNGKKNQRYVIYFVDGNNHIPLVKQRAGIREFSSLQAAANTIERIGPDNFRVLL
jgi:hypothetical protein